MEELVRSSPRGWGEKGGGEGEKQGVIRWTISLLHCVDVAFRWTREEKGGEEEHSRSCRFSFLRVGSLTKKEEEGERSHEPTATDRARIVGQHGKQPRRRKKEGGERKGKKGQYHRKALFGNLTVIPAAG